MNPLYYLFSAFMAMWVILAGYLFSLHRREKKLQAEIERIKRILEPSR